MGSGNALFCGKMKNIKSKGEKNAVRALQCENQMNVLLSGATVQAKVTSCSRAQTRSVLLNLLSC